MSQSTRHPLSQVLPKLPEGPMRVPARALGWFSIGLGLSKLAMPKKVARAAGMPNLPALTRAYGLREIGTGIGILTSKDPTPWLWGRVAGDVLDVATVGTGLITERRPLRTLGAIAMLLGAAYVDMKVAEAAPPKKKRAPHSGRDYSMRSGFPKPAADMRGIALEPSRPMKPRFADSSADMGHAWAAPASPAVTSPS